MTNNEIILNDSERTECEIWTRVMGYYRPISAFNKGKRSEYNDRKCFKEDCACDDCIESYKKVA